MTITNNTTSDAAYILNNLGKIYYFLEDEVSFVGNIDGVETCYYRWRQGQTCELRGIIQTDKHVGLEVEFLTIRNKQYHATETIPLNKFNNILSAKDILDSSNLNRGAPQHQIAE